jgi:sesquipedalian
VSDKRNRHLIHYARSTARIDKTGWLHKRGYLNSAYKRRFFVLKGNLLFYFDTNDYTTHDPLGVIVLEGYTISLGQPTDLFVLEV